MTKKCSRCLVCKNMSEFYADKSARDGVGYWCKDCVKHNHKIWRTKNREHCRAYSQKRRERDRQGNTTYQREWMRKNRLKNKLRTYARNSVARAVKVGDLVKLPCRVCGEEEVEAHHNDYEDRLRVEWLCKNHHTAWHRVFEVEN